MKPLLVHSSALILAVSWAAEPIRILVWKVGQGRLFYFRPSHETYPIFKPPESLRVLENAARWMTK